MPFVKLDTGILDSSLWIEREQRELFLTALLMAVPYYLPEPAAEIETEGTNETGFVVPAGFYGLVRASSLGIIGRALLHDHVNLDQLMKELQELASPDPWSRSAEFEGRRMVRISGGYIILNYAKYREMDRTAAERAKRYRDKKKEDNVTRDERDATGDDRDGVTQAEAEAEAEAINKKSSLNGSVEPCQTALPLPVVSKPKKSPMMSGDALKELATNPAYDGLDVYKESHKFKTWCETNGKTQSKRRFVNWLNRIT